MTVDKVQHMDQNDYMLILAIKDVRPFVKVKGRYFAIGRYLAGGGSGIVYSATEVTEGANRHFPWIIKFTKYYPDIDRQLLLELEFEDEHEQYLNISNSGFTQCPYYLGMQEFEFKGVTFKAMVMEEVGAGVLQLLMNQELSAQVQLDMPTLALDALESLHRAGFTHGDYFLRNWSYCKKTERFKLIDFGRVEAITDSLDSRINVLVDYIVLVQECYSLADPVANCDSKFLRALQAVEIDWKNLRVLEPLLDGFDSGMVQRRIRRAFPLTNALAQDKKAAMDVKVEPEVLQVEPLLKVEESASDRAPKMKPKAKKIKERRSKRLAAKSEKRRSRRLMGLEPQ